MRIIGGEFRGRPLAGVGKGDPRNHLRPTPDRVRESLFNLLSGGRFGDPITDAIVLDLFSGTGALGLEALSRGAQHAHFVESGRKSLSVLNKNIAQFGVAQRTHTHRNDATRPGLKPEDPATLIFLDPPYGKGLGERALAAHHASGWIGKDTLVVWEENAPMTSPSGFIGLETRRYGDTHITILRSDDTEV